MSREKTSLEEKIQARTATIAVIGLGYVGLPVAVEFARIGFPVVGVDVDREKVEQLKRGQSYIADVDSADVAQAVSEGRMRVSTGYHLLAEADVIFICVPTPITDTKSPDLSYIVAAAEGIAQHLQPGQLIILESTTYPGTTEEEVLPILEAGGLEAGRDFYLAFSPERIDPGNKVYTFANTPKVVGGFTPRCGQLARQLLSIVTSQVELVSSPRAAEMTKLLENTFRNVNIALVNELAKLCERMGIDIWEVIDAASTKPYGFMPFYPGPGVGGHCIPVDPYYLSWKAREYDFYTKFIEFAADFNHSMPYHVVTRLGEALGSRGVLLPGAKVLVLGVAFKRDIEDARNSPAERIIELLLQRGAEVSYNDPFVPTFTVGNDVFRRESLTLESVPLTDEALAAADCVLIVTGHSRYDYRRIVRQARLVFDACNATRGVEVSDSTVFKIGTAPRPPRVRQRRA